LFLKLGIPRKEKLLTSSFPLVFVYLTTPAHQFATILPASTKSDFFQNLFTTPAVRATVATTTATVLPGSALATATGGVPGSVVRAEAASATVLPVLDAGGVSGSGRGKAKSKKLEVGRTSDMFAMAAQSVMGRATDRARERGEQDEEEKFCSFLAMKMRSVSKANKTAVEIAILELVNEFM
jgi:hypothetical protein